MSFQERNQTDYQSNSQYALSIKTSQYKKIANLDKLILDINMQLKRYYIEFFQQQRDNQSIAQNFYDKDNTIVKQIKNCFVVHSIQEYFIKKKLLQSRPLKYNGKTKFSCLNCLNDWCGCFLKCCLKDSLLDGQEKTVAGKILDIYLKFQRKVIIKK